MYQLSIAVVTYQNSIDILSQTISSILKSKLHLRVYIIDNSPDSTLQSLCNDPKIEYIFMNSNHGFGYAHNVILKNSTKMGKYHLVLNPDVYFEKGTLEQLYEYMENNSDVGNVMPKVVYPNGELQYLCKLLPRPQDWIIRMFLPIKVFKDRIDYNLEMRFADYNMEMNVPYLSGCFMLLRSSVIEDVGVFDDGIFMYGEDTDLNRRIHGKYRTMYYPSVKIVHNFEKGSHKSFRLLWIHIKAAVYYLNKWGWFIDKERKLINKRAKELYGGIK